MSWELKSLFLSVDFGVVESKGFLEQQQKKNGPVLV